MSKEKFNYDIIFIDNEINVYDESIIDDVIAINNVKYNKI